MHQIISDLLRTALEATVSSTVELGITAVFDRDAGTSSSASTDEAVTVMHAFLMAVAQRDADSLYALAAPRWTVLPETAELFDRTWGAAPPVDWSFDQVYVPADWAGGTPEWVYAELTVTFDVETGYESIPAVLRTCPSADGWQVDYLDWGFAGPEAEPEPEPEPEPQALGFESLQFRSLADLFQPTVVDAAEVVECAGCGQFLRVPTHKGRLRVSCPKCGNVQWYTP